MRIPKKPGELLQDINEHTHSEVRHYVNYLEDRKYSSKNDTTFFNMHWNKKLMVGFVGLGLTSFACVVAAPAVIPLVGVAAVYGTMTASLAGSIASIIGAKIIPFIDRYKMDKRLEAVHEVMNDYGIHPYSKLGNLSDQSKTELVSILGATTQELNTLHETGSVKTLINVMRNRFQKEDPTNGMKVS